MSRKKSKLDQEALSFHSSGRPGKLEITATKPLMSQHDLSLAYSPGVAAPCLAIEADPDTAYDYTAKGNIIAVISNGTAVLGLGDIGAAASKPVMEGKAVLFKKFADIDGIDLEVDTHDTDKFVDAVAMLAPSFGGINLEDIKSPECFIIEQQLRERLEIPVFHDDQHGTAIIAAAGLINALHLTGREMKDIRVVSNGAGAASIACVELIKNMGVPHGNVTLVDRSGVIYQGREEFDEPVEIGACGENRGALAGRGACRRRRVSRAVGGRGAEPVDGRDDGRPADHLRDGQSGSRNHARRRRRRFVPTPSSPPAGPTIRTR